MPKLPVERNENVGAVVGKAKERASTALARQHIYVEAQVLFCTLQPFNSTNDARPHNVAQMGGTAVCPYGDVCDASGVALAAQATKGHQQCWPCFLRHDGEHCSVQHL